MRESPTDERWWPRAWSGPLVPVDALATLVFATLATGVLLSAGVESAVLRAVVGLPFLLFLPGYSLLTAFFPRSKVGGARRLSWPEPRGSVDALRRGGLDWRERVALSFGTSLVLLPLLALVVSGAGLPFSTTVIVATLVGWTLCWTAVGVVRRLRLAPERRFEVPYRDWLSVVDRGVFGQSAGVDAALDVALAALVVTSLAGVGYAVAVPNNAESFTSVSLLAPTDDGDLAAANYPDTLAAADQRLVVRVQNDEGTATTYTVVAMVSTARSAGADSAAESRAILDRATNTVADGGAWDWRHDVPVRETSDGARLTYFVYRGSAPTEPDRESAYRHVSIWLDGGADADD